MLKKFSSRDHYIIRMPILVLLTKYLTILPLVSPIFLAVAKICVWLTHSSDPFAHE